MKIMIHLTYADPISKLYREINNAYHFNTEAAALDAKLSAVV